MRIALLNLPFDNNYGGNLQRFALMQVLQNMGYDVTHLMVCFTWYDTRLPGHFPLYTLLNRMGRKLLKDKNVGIYPERYNKKRFIKDNESVLPFYERYVRHTKMITSYEDLCKYKNFDTYIVGSDQVWRKKMTVCYPFSSLFFDFLCHKNAKRLAYGVSFGTNENELSEEEIRKLGELYSKFDAVSVREDTGLDLLESYGWTCPKGQLVLDPTFLLSKDKYLQIIKAGKTYPSRGNMFCYVLDANDEIEHTISSIANAKGLNPFRMSINTDGMFSIEQWLRSFIDSDYVVTDSFHGFVFSIIFNKPVKLIENKFRGNERFESVKRMLSYNPNQDDIDWDAINSKIRKWTDISISFLKTSLETNNEY